MNLPKCKLIFALWAFICLSFSLSAQRKDSLLITPAKTKNDSLSSQARIDTLLSKLDILNKDSTSKTKYHFPKSWTVNWDSRNSFIQQKPVNIWGINVAFVHGKKQHQITLGYYWLTYNSLLRLIDLSKGSASLINLDYYTKRDLYFVSTMYWWNFINNKKFQLSMPLEVGMGATANQGTSLQNDFLLWERNDFFMPVQAGIYFEWKATRWVGLSLQGGYRYALIQHDIKNNYNSIYYSFGISLQTGLLTDIYGFLFKDKKKDPKK